MAGGGVVAPSPAVAEIDAAPLTRSIKVLLGVAEPPGLPLLTTPIRLNSCVEKALVRERGGAR